VQRVAVRLRPSLSVQYSKQAVEGRAFARHDTDDSRGSPWAYATVSSANPANAMIEFFEQQIRVEAAIVDKRTAM